MADTSCTCCGEVFPINKKRCPLCGAVNVNYVDKGELEQTKPAEKIKSKSASTIECNCCGEKYDMSMESCPLCATPNIFYEQHEEYGSNAVLIDEDGEFEPISKKTSSSGKQNSLDPKLVLFAFIGVIFIIFMLLFKAFTGVVEKSSSRIGVEIFNTQESDTHQGR